MDRLVKWPKKINYKLIAAVGSGRFPKTGDVPSLLFDLPYFFAVKVIPPLQVVNEVLGKGILDAGMSGGCKWKPFQLSVAEYELFVKDLKKLRFRAILPPEWVQSHADWHSWCCELMWGIPAQESRRMSNQISEVQEQYEAAMKNGDPVAAELLSRVTSLCIEHSNFMNRHRLAKPRMPHFRRPESR